MLKNIANYNFKLLFVLIMYFFRRTASKLWYYFRINEKIVNPSYLAVYYIVFYLIVIDMSYFIISLLFSNSLFHVSALFMVAILQLPSLRIFPHKDKRYEGAPQEMVYNTKSKPYFTLSNYVFTL
jgi:hypothetical protein